MRAQSVINRQGSEGEVDVPDELAQKVNKHLEIQTYMKLLESGCWREQSENLPQSTYTNSIGKSIFTITALSSSQDGTRCTAGNS